MQEPLLEWMSVFLISKEIYNSLFTMRASEKQSLEVVSRTHYSKHFFFSRFSFFLLHLSENTKWLFIEKIVIIACNWLNSQCNQLFQKSNWLYYHFNRLKCSSQHLEDFQEQCNCLDSWCNRLKCSWSLLETLLRTK